MAHKNEHEQALSRSPYTDLPIRHKALLAEDLGPLVEELRLLPRLKPHVRRVIHYHEGYDDADGEDAAVKALCHCD